MLALELELPRDAFNLKIETRLAQQGIWGIMGSSGCGKTSLLRCIAGLEKQAKGRIVFNGQIWLDSKNKTCIAPEQRNIGYIFQEARLFPHLTVAGNLQFAVKRATGKNISSYEDIVEQCGIAHLLNRNIDKLSGGEKQRVAIARALLSNPQLLLMDEPLASLDWSSKIAFIPCLRNIYQHFNIPIVIVSHAREEVARLADYLMIMERGRVFKQGLCNQLLKESVYGEHASGAILSVLDGEVVGHDPNYLLTELEVDGYRLVANQTDMNVGDKTRLVLSAHDISLVLDDVKMTSVQNKLHLEISDVQPVDAYHQAVTLKLGEQLLTAVVTKKSAELLELSMGNKVFAHFKASGLEVV